MQPETIAKLIDINRQFYQQFAAAFDETRQRLQPGVAGLLDELIGCSAILDLGCGNGTLFETLQARGFEGQYTGLDFSEGLVRRAREKIEPEVHAQFMIRDLTAPDWARGLQPVFDRALAFAVFHHLPPAVAENVLKELRGLLHPDGDLIHSNWHFLKSPRWRTRVQPWESAGLDPELVGPDDYLLDWQRGGTGLRYVHYYSEEELARLAAATGFRIIDSFYSDGKEGDLALYQVWRPSSSPG